MAGWYTVVKTVKGHRYRYLQQSYREGGRVRTRNRYLGKADGGDAGTTHSAENAAVITTPLFSSPADFGQAIADQFDAAKWGQDAGAQLLGSGQQKRKQRNGRHPAQGRNDSQQRHGRSPTVPHNPSTKQTGLASDNQISMAVDPNAEIILERARAHMKVDDRQARQDAVKIAKLEGKNVVEPSHMAEALQFQNPSYLAQMKPGGALEARAREILGDELNSRTGHGNSLSNPAGT